MRIYHSSNLLKFIDDHAGFKGLMTILPSTQDGKETIKTYTSSFNFLGEIARTTTIEGKPVKGAQLLSAKDSGKESAVKIYTLEVSLWKAVALAVLSPFYLIQYLFGITNGLINQDRVTIKDVTILGSRDIQGNDILELQHKRTIFEYFKEPYVFFRGNPAYMSESADLLNN